MINRNHKLVDTLFNIYTVMLGIILLLFYLTFLSNLKLSIFDYIYIYGFRVDSLQMYLANSIQALTKYFPRFLSYILFSSLFIAIETLIVIKQRSKPQLLIEALLYFLFTGDITSTLILLIIMILNLKFLTFFINENKNEKKRDVECFSNEAKLSTLLIAFGSLLLMFSLESLVFRFITVTTLVVYMVIFIGVAFLKLHCLARQSIAKIILVSIPPFGVVVLMKSS